ncbi:hypothetical protein BZB76_5531 [Actinomadura pelletieri DSM 43383]|uniref:Uncharacterized protein n=1 Tax=Actinomadura pelletieri DSM 43383 TaxID=1120940 RepID=A0A495QGS4_9ACTN|nr:hypothetical protein [Actinomadura pelletieri]RKS71049.1 hypothetical protein BZB76_5531 [Actinomadura pelletieri DSM 43383]
MAEVDVHESHIRQIAQDVISEVAPEERAAFPVVADRFFRSEEKALSGHGRRHGAPISWGLGEAVPLLTPVVLWVLSRAIEEITGEAVRAPVRPLGRVLRRWTGREDDRPRLELTDDQVAHIGRMAEQIVVDHGHEPATAESVAAVLVRRLRQNSE